ncbi:MAG: hypothetical protein K6253_00610 [Candidatus Liberibacter asiaticus]|nr:hypothetical protein [Candidatus Liberibacter asiaticus]
MTIKRGVCWEATQFLNKLTSFCFVGNKEKPWSLEVTQIKYFITSSFEGVFLSFICFCFLYYILGTICMISLGVGNFCFFSEIIVLW